MGIYYTWLVFLAFCSLLLLFGIVVSKWKKLNDFKRNALHYHGTVIDYALEEISSSLYAPVIEYQTMTGIKCYFIDKYYSSTKNYRIGQNVEILVHSEMPNLGTIIRSNKNFQLF